MSKLSKLLQVTDEEKKAVLRHYDMTEEQFEENVIIMKEWLRKCDHLPHENNDNKLRLALLNSKMSLEKAKQSVEGYYRIRALYSVEIFDKMIPTSKEYSEAKNLVRTVVMPKLTPDLCRITVYKLCDPQGKANDAYLYQIMSLMLAEIRLSNDYFLSNILVVDFTDYCLKNLIKFTPSINQKLVNILNVLNIRIHSVHFLNMPPFVDHLMSILKSVLPNKIMHKIYSHKNVESLYQHIPKDYLPEDYGGAGKSLEDLYDEWCEQIEASEDYFKKLLNLKLTGKVDMDATEEMCGMGAQGSFKKLVVD